MSKRPSPLQRELHQKRPFTSPHQECVVGLMRTAEVVRRALSRTLGPHDLTLQQYNVLRILRGAGNDGIPTLEIGVRMIEQSPGVTRLLDRLERKGLARRARCPHDRRRILCWSTPAAVELLGRLDAALSAAEQELLGELDAGALRRLIRLMDGVRAGANAASRP